MVVKGQIISGEFGKLVMRQKAGQDVEIGELLISEKGDATIILQAYDVLYGSQISQQNLELVAGMHLEEQLEPEFYDASLRNYQLALLKPVAIVKQSKASMSKMLPPFFSAVRELSKEDVSFLQQPHHPFFLGKLRSGSKTLDVDITLDGKEVLSHHVLIAGTTGRGKSNLIRNLLWGAIGTDYCGILVLDPHDEYYGNSGAGLKDHPSGNVSYYTARAPPPGGKTLKVNLELVKPHHLDGVVQFSDAQRQALYLYYKEHGDNWIESIILEKPLSLEHAFKEDTLAVVKRRLLQLLDLEFSNNQLFCNGIFQLNAGSTVIADITRDLESGKIVIIDTSSFSGAVELLVGSLVAHEAFSTYKYYKMENKLKDKPVISIVLEEAPRVLGKEVLEKGSNIFSTIAREGRKFKVGLVAITQLPSLIPREILANMNTKIILGIEMKPERQAIIESAAQDLSEHDRTIASLDKGEAIVSSTFAAMVLPVKVPFFENVAKASRKTSAPMRFSELG
jgi:DNA helicase HerA-like ATPase